LTAPPAVLDRTAARAILERLISFDTTSHRSNGALIDWVADYLSTRGVAATRLTSADAEKHNLLALVGPRVEGAVVLSGHTDVVPVVGQPWTSDPWRLVERDGRFYGRGAADMKSFLALALAAVDCARALPLARPLVLAFTHDEEVGCLGAPALIARLDDFVPAPAAVIVGEPTDMRVVSAHKGINTYRVEVIGREAHSSQVDQGVSAIHEALKLMVFLRELAAEYAGAGPSPLFDPPGPTMTIGQVEGGTAANILARQCAFIWDLRCPPGIDPDAIEARFRARAGALDAEIKVRAPEGGVLVTRRTEVPAMAPAPDSPAEALARAFTGDNEMRAALFGAEAGLFQRAGLPVVLCGPGSIRQAHQPDEYIEAAQFEAGARFMDKLLAALCA